MKIAAILNTDTMDEWRPRKLACMGDSGGSGEGSEPSTGDAGGGYNTSDFSGEFNGSASDAYSSNFDSAPSGGSNTGSFNSGSFTGDAGGGYNASDFSGGGTVGNAYSSNEGGGANGGGGTFNNDSFTGGGVSYTDGSQSFGNFFGNDNGASFYPSDSGGWNNFVSPSDAYFGGSGVFSMDPTAGVPFGQAGVGEGGFSTGHYGYSGPGGPEGSGGNFGSGPYASGMMGPTGYQGAGGWSPSGPGNQTYGYGQPQDANLTPGLTLGINQAKPEGKGLVESLYDVTLGDLGPLAPGGFLGPGHQPPGVIGIVGPPKGTEYSIPVVNLDPVDVNDVKGLQDQVQQATSNFGQPGTQSGSQFGPPSAQPAPATPGAPPSAPPVTPVADLPGAPPTTPYAPPSAPNNPSNPSTGYPTPGQLQDKSGDKGINPGLQVGPNGQMFLPNVTPDLRSDASPSLPSWMPPAMPQGSQAADAAKSLLDMAPKQMNAALLEAARPGSVTAPSFLDTVRDFFSPSQAQAGDPNKAVAEALKDGAQFQQAGPFMAARPAPTSGPAAPGAAPGSVQVPGSQNTFKGTDATANAKPYEGIIIHRTGFQDIATQADWQMHNRQGLGYPFVIDPSGQVFQFGDPATSRSNHIKESKGRTSERDLNNKNSLGIGLITPNGELTEAQAQALNQLVPWAQGQYGIPAGRVYGHSEVQGRDKARANIGPGGTPEGRTFAQQIRDLGAVSAGLPPNALQPTAPPQAGRGPGASQDSRNASNFGPADPGKLAESRAPVMDELRGDPNLKSRLLAMAAAEVGSQGRDAVHAFIESVINRAAANQMAGKGPQTLKGVLNQRGYFPGKTFRSAGKVQAGKRDAGAADDNFDEILDDIAKGSDVAKSSTGNSSASKEGARFGGLSTRATIGGEHYGIENNAAARAWAKAMEGTQVASVPLPPARPPGAQATGPTNPFALLPQTPPAFPPPPPVAFNPTVPMGPPPTGSPPGGVGGPPAQPGPTYAPAREGGSPPGLPGAIPPPGPPTATGSPPGLPGLLSFAPPTATGSPPGLPGRTYGPPPTGASGSPPGLPGTPPFAPFRSDGATGSPPGLPGTLPGQYNPMDGATGSPGGLPGEYPQGEPEAPPAGEPSLPVGDQGGLQGETGRSGYPSTATDPGGLEGAVPGKSPIRSDWLVSQATQGVPSGRFGENPLPAPPGWMTSQQTAGKNGEFSDTFSGRFGSWGPEGTQAEYGDNYGRPEGAPVAANPSVPMAPDGQLPVSPGVLAPRGPDSAAPPAFVSQPMLSPSKQFDANQKSISAKFHLTEADKKAGKDFLSGLSDKDKAAVINKEVPIIAIIEREAAKAAARGDFGWAASKLSSSFIAGKARDHVTENYPGGIPALQRDATHRDMTQPTPSGIVSELARPGGPEAYDNEQQGAPLTSFAPSVPMAPMAPPSDPQSMTMTQGVPYIGGMNPNTSPAQSLMQFMGAPDYGLQPVSPAPAPFTPGGGDFGGKGTTGTWGDPADTFDSRFGEWESPESPQSPQQFTPSVPQAQQDAKSDPQTASRIAQANPQQVQQIARDFNVDIATAAMILKDYYESQRGDISLMNMMEERRLRINPGQWERFLREQPPSTNIEDRRQPAY